MPIPPLRAISIAFLKRGYKLCEAEREITISASVTVSMLEDTIGLLSVMFRDRRVLMLTPRRLRTGDRCQKKPLNSFEMIDRAYLGNKQHIIVSDG